MDKQSARYMIQRLQAFPKERQFAILDRIEKYGHGVLRGSDGFSKEELEASRDIIDHGQWVFGDNTLEEAYEGLDHGTGYCDACGQFNALRSLDTSSGEGDFCKWGCE